MINYSEYVELVIVIVFVILKRYEDTELSDLKPLPTPKIVATPDGIANELFGDIAMILEFIGCYRGLLMPGKTCQITAGKCRVVILSCL